MGFLSKIFGGGGSSSTSAPVSTTQSGTGTGLVASGVTGDVTNVINDPGAARDALQANAYAVDRTLQGAERAFSIAGDTVGRGLDTVDAAVGALSGASDKSFAYGQNVFANALETVAQVVEANNATLAKGQELYYGKIADNAGVAPQTLQMANQNNVADITKLAIFGAVLVGGAFLLSKNTK